MNRPSSKNGALLAPWSFVHVADMHVGTPRSYRFQPAWNENWAVARDQILELEPDLLLVGGDMTRDGSTHRLELETVKHDLDRLPFPAHVIPGNHEVGNKFEPDSPVAIQPDHLRLYRSVFGASCWSFLHKGVRFSGFDAFLLGSGLPEEAHLRDWLQRQTEEPQERHNIWMIHPALFADRPDEPDWDRVTHRVEWYFVLDGDHRNTLLETFRRAGATHVITSHIHCRREAELDGLQISFSPATAFPQWGERWPDGDPRLGFLHFTVSESGIEKRFVPLRSLSTRNGYGPGGNPGLRGRDYSHAWEQPPLDVEENRLPAGSPKRH
ncbi:MAG: metallophosphoesterase [Bacteroidota bacterium]